MKIYKPSSIILTDEEPRRRFFTDYRHTDGKPLNEDDITSYDSRTLIFDTFLIEDLLICLGPPLLNLEKELGRLSLSLNGEPVYYRYKNQLSFRFFEIESKIHPHLINDGENVVQFSYQNGITKKTIANKIDPYANKGLVLTAIQKNNRLNWIEDWFKYYRDAISVDHLVLYDNGSSNWNELTELNQPDITLVSWDFPFGPIYSHKNKYAQVGANNHCRLSFGKYSTISSFDIDELLVFNNERFSDSLKKKDILYFNQYFVPHTKDIGEDYTFSSYRLRSNVPKNTSKKMIYKADKVTATTLHYAFTSRFLMINKFVLKLRKLESRLSYKHLAGGSPFLGRIFDIFIRMLTSPGIAQHSVPIRNAYFLHFMGITTGWKTYLKRLNTKDNSKLVEDRIFGTIRKVLS